jgi:hypothetical protein
MNNESKPHVSFRNYFNELGGKTISILYENKEILIFDNKQVNVGRLKIGKSAMIAGLNIELLLKENLQVGDKHYAVLLNGIDNYDWLFAVDIVHKI